MNEYVAMWKNYVNFSDRTTVRGYWMAILFNIIFGVILTTLITFFPALTFVSSIYGLAVFLPSLAIVFRRLRDAGKSWTNIFWLLLPLIGSIYFLVLMCKSSVEDNGVPVV